MSNFNEVTAKLKEYHTTQYDALLNKSVKKWSTTPYSSYSQMLQTLADTTELNEKLSSMYTEARSSKSQRNWAKSSGNELQLQFINAIKTSVRRKFIQDKDSEMSSLAQNRYNANERKEAIAILERLKELINSRVQ